MFGLKTRVFNLQKVQKNTVLSKMAIQHITCTKAKFRSLSLFTINTQI